MRHARHLGIYSNYSYKYTYRFSYTIARWLAARRRGGQVMQLQEIADLG